MKHGLMCKIIIIWLMTLTTGCNSAPIPHFDADNAFLYLEKQCAFGPRIPGSAAHQQCRDYLVSTLQLYADQVTTQPFMFTFGKPAKSVTATNIIAAFQPQKRDRILLCAHWDTRPWADMDKDPKNHNQPVIGANDGASGVAVLLEIAKILHSQKPEIGIDIVLFDAEDAGEYNVDESWAQGSAAFVRQYRGKLTPRYGILLDMIGDADLNVYKEGFSNEYAKPIVDLVWQQAAALGIREFIPEVRHIVTDDHLAFLKAGIPCIDIIDFDYPWWHTIHDTPDKCSPASLGKIGAVLVHLIY
ncbi:MAG TPA: M28 family peptidase [bacterium]|nr:M28 family peptidase [bacterium]HPN44279.1 M28 family peptidase [bacterium]